MSSTIGKMTTKHCTEIQVPHYYILDATVPCFTIVQCTLTKKLKKNKKILTHDYSH